MDLISASSIQCHMSVTQASIVLQLFKNQTLLNKFDEEEEAMNEETIKLMELLSSTKIKSRVWRHPFSTDWWDTKVPQFPESLFVRHFRVNFQIFDYLVEKLTSKLQKKDTRWRDAISVRKRIAVGLKLLATTCDYLTVAALFGIGRSSAHRCFIEFINAVHEVLVPNHIKFPSELEEFKHLAQEFESQWQFPMVFGAIDGSHIPFRAPKHLASDFYNYKGWHSVIIIAICDADGKAIWIKSGVPGRQSDSGAFKETLLYRKITTQSLIPMYEKEINGCKMPLMMLGDSGFAMESWLIKPFTHHTQMNEQQKLFNSRLSRARRIVENFFGRLKGRWRRLYRGVDVSYANVHKVINVAVTLHNICEDHRVSYRPSQRERNENEMFELQQPQPYSVSSTSSVTGELIRNALMGQFNSETQPWDTDIEQE